MTSEFTAMLHQRLQEYVLPGGDAPYFAKVFKGEPEALMPSNAPLCRWHVTRSETPPEGPRVLSGNRMTAAVFQVHCYWPLSASEERRESQEDDIAIVLIDLPNEFIGLTAADYTIGGYPLAAITVEDITPVERDTPFPMSDRDMRILTFEVHARILEAS